MLEFKKALQIQAVLQLFIVPEELGGLCTLWSFSEHGSSGKDFKLHTDLINLIPAALRESILAYRAGPIKLLCPTIRFLESVPASSSSGNS